MKILPSSRISSIATSDSFPTSDQSTQTNNKLEEESVNSTTELHQGSALNSDNDRVLPNDVLNDSSEPSDKLAEKIESATQGADIESVIDRNELSKEHIDTNRIAEAVLLDSISTNSGING